jgi:hypothetical protein
MILLHEEAELLSLHHLISIHVAKGTVKNSCIAQTSPCIPYQGHHLSGVAPFFIIVQLWHTLFWNWCLLKPWLLLIHVPFLSSFIVTV